jgi:hypothetical protein
VSVLSRVGLQARPPASVAPGQRGLWIRRHAAFGVVVLAAAALRAVVQLAYLPALFTPDSYRYLAYAAGFLKGILASDGQRVSGYSVALVPFVWAHDLGGIVALQHVLGLACGVLVYALLVARGSRRGLAVLASLPVLFDPLQLNVEQYVLADTMATFFLLVAVAVLAWPGRWRWWRAPAAGLLLACATLTREPDLVTRRPWRRALSAAGALALTVVLALMLPLAVYGITSHTTDVGGRLSGYAWRYLYGRVAPIARCDKLHLPADEEQLCPRRPVGQRPTPNYYMWSARSPQWNVRVPPGTSATKVLEDFDRSVVLGQPLSFAKLTATEYAYGFSPVRAPGPDGNPAWVYKFQSHYTAWNISAAWVARTYGRTRVASRPGLERFLHRYGRYYTPGPLLAAGLILALAAAAGLGPARRSGLRGLCFLLGATAATELIPPVVMSMFSWRYELPQLSLIPLAAAAALTALLPSCRADSPQRLPAGGDSQGTAAIVTREGPGDEPVHG